MIKSLQLSKIRSFILFYSILNIYTISNKATINYTLQLDWSLCLDECNNELTFAKGNFLIRNEFSLIFFLFLFNIWGLNLLLFGLYKCGRLYSTSIGCLRLSVLVLVTFCLKLKTIITYCCRTVTWLCGSSARNPLTTYFYLNRILRSFRILWAITMHCMVRISLMMHYDKKKNKKKVK